MSEKLTLEDLRTIVSQGFVCGPDAQADVLGCLSDAICERDGLREQWHTVDLADPATLPGEDRASPVIGVPHDIPSYSSGVGWCNIHSRWEDADGALWEWDTGDRWTERPGVAE